MQLYKNLAKFYDLLYSYKDYSREVNFLIEGFATGDFFKVLDVACGTGKHLEALKEKLPLVEFVGIDLNQEMLNVAQDRLPDVQFYKYDMRSFDLNQNFDIVYCLSSSIQYNINSSEFIDSVNSMRRHAIGGKVIFDLAFCIERWQEGYTNITVNSNSKFDVAELYTTHSSNGLSYWNPLYLIKDKTTGSLDMHVDKHVIKLWSIPEVKQMLSDNDIPFTIKFGFSKANNPSDVPIFVLEGVKYKDK